MNVIEVRHLYKSFPFGFWGRKRLILKDVSFQIRAGRTTGFIGVNGSGKTTTMKCLFHFIHPDQGDVLFWGQPLSKTSLEKIGYFPERPYLYEFMTGESFLKLHWQLQGSHGDFEKQCTDLLQKVDLLSARKQKIRSYSKGMMQRIGLAQALLGNPELLLLDEPMSGLDPDGRWLVKQILHEQKQKGTTIFFSSHLLQDMEELCDDLVMMDQGEIIYQGESKVFLSNSSDSLEKSFQDFRNSFRQSKVNSQIQQDGTKVVP